MEGTSGCDLLQVIVPICAHHSLHHRTHFPRVDVVRFEMLSPRAVQNWLSFWPLLSLVVFAVVVYVMLMLLTVS